VYQGHEIIKQNLANSIVIIATKKENKSETNFVQHQETSTKTLLEETQTHCIHCLPVRITLAICLYKGNVQTAI